jgi:hypothetical protein
MHQMFEKKRTTRQKSQSQKENLLGEFVFNKEHASTIEQQHIPKK